MVAPRGSGYLLSDRRALTRARAAADIASANGISRWRAMRSSIRPTTLRNVSRYIHSIGIDQPLAGLLEAAGAISETEAGHDAERASVALEIISARDALGSAWVRAGLARSLSLDVPLSARQISPESGELLGLLIEYGIIADDATAFEDRLWSTGPLARQPSAGPRSLLTTPAPRFCRPTVSRGSSTAPNPHRLQAADFRQHRRRRPLARTRSASRCPVCG